MLRELRLAQTDTVVQSGVPAAWPSPSPFTHPPAKLFHPKRRHTKESSDTQSLWHYWGSAIKDARYSAHLDVVAACVLLMVLTFGECVYGTQVTYTGSVSTALNELAAGKTRESLTALGAALTCNSNDPLAHVTLGLTLLMGGRAADADAEFKAALALDASCAEALYGRALVCLSKGSAADATALFCQAQGANPKLNMRGAIRYAKLLAGGTDSEDAGADGDESLLALDAYALTKAGRLVDAAGLWKQLQPKTVRQGFGERLGCSMTFMKEQPLAVVGWPLDASAKVPSADTSKLPVVSGKAALRADLSRAQSVALVSFFVDDKLVGITNRAPFEYMWDTSEAANGPHTVRITGVDSGGAMVSERSARVVVRNAGEKRRCDRVTGPEASAAWEKLWQLMKLKPSASAVNYHLALCAEAGGDTATVIAALERVMAADPGYLDAAERLSKLRGVGPDASLYGVPTKAKAIAITFDDGPKTETPRLLDVLKQKGVRATFFVVGKQVDAYPQTLKRMADEGHEIQNHTYSHRALEYLSSREIEQELFKCASAVRSVIGTGTTMIRPPGAHHGKALAEVTRKFGFRTVFWTANCAKVEGTNRQKIANFVLSSAKPGAIVLMHNVDRVTLAALPQIIDTLKSRGYTFVTLSEMLSKRT